MGEVTHKYSSGGSVGKQEKVLCLDCAKRTNHRVEASFEHDGSDVDEDNGWSFDWSSEYQIVRCMGCDSVSFRHLESTSEDFPEQGPEEKLYPKRATASIPKKDFETLPPGLERIYGEVIDCYNDNIHTLCAAGLRAIVEGICADQNIVDGPVEVPLPGGGTKMVRKRNLEGMIFGLHEKGLLTAQNAATLHEHRFLGNHAVHELKKPSMMELRLAIEIIEHTLEQIYELPRKASELKRRLDGKGKGVG
jgi:hypothetical protein